MDYLEKQKGTSSILCQALYIISEPQVNSNWSYSQFASKLAIFCPVWLEMWRMTLKNNRALLLCCFKLGASFHSHQWWVTVRKIPTWDKIDDFFVASDLEIWQMTLENNRAPLLCYFKLCAPFGSHWWIQTVFTVRKCLICVKNVDFVSLVTLKFDGWPWKTIRHLS